MFSTDVGVWVYELSKCAYFPWKGGGALFGGPAATFDCLQAWAHGKPLGQTTTFQVKQESTLTEVFLLGMHKAPNGDFLVAVWNRLPGSQSHVASVGVSDLVGAASAEQNAVDPNRIPGYATYFWILPAENRIATIRLKHLNNGLANFRHYMNNFLTYVNPCHVVLDTPGTDGSVRVKGYRSSAADDLEDGGVRATFNVKSLTSGSDLAKLRQDVSKIDKVCFKTSLSTIEARDYRFWEVFQDVGRIFRKPGPVIEEVPIKVEMKVDFDIDAFNKTVQSWEDDLNDSESRTNDIGFKVRGHSKYTWLSKTQARKSFPLNIEWVDGEQVNLDSLMQQLQLKRSEILLLG